MARPRTDIAPRILAAARTRFVKKGVNGSSLRAIARDAGTSIGMVYYYFPTKDDLFFAVVEQTYEKILAAFERSLAPDASVEDRLRRLFETVADVSQEEAEVLQLVARDALLSSARRDRLFQRFLRGHIPLVFATIGEGVASGVLDRRRHPLVLLFATFALAGPPQVLRRALGERLVPGAPTGKALAHELCDVLFHGIGAADRA